MSQLWYIVQPKLLFANHHLTINHVPCFANIHKYFNVQLRFCANFSARRLFFALFTHFKSLRCTNIKSLNLACFSFRFCCIKACRRFATCLHVKRLIYYTSFQFPVEQQKMKIGRKNITYNLIRWNVFCMEVFINESASLLHVHLEKNYCLRDTNSLFRRHWRNVQAEAVQWNMKGYFTAWTSSVKRKVILKQTATRSDVIKDLKKFLEKRNRRISFKCWAKSQSYFQ